jgi:glycosyltransferase involved in cell wall biosynthesis
VRTYVVVCAYRPSAALVELVRALHAAPPLAGVIVVDDGSGPAHAPVFAAVAGFPRVELLRHAVNLGKGAALKTGLNHAVAADPGCLVVTADADGQHLPEDVLRVAEVAAARSDTLVLGARAFDVDVPWKSRFGNGLTRRALRAVIGLRLRDTQTGLRAIPAGLVPHLLRLASRGYEFEVDMLMVCRQLGFAVAETSIQTVYLDGNASSHFDPLLDSLRIYVTLLRFVGIALRFAVVDLAVFLVLFAALAPHLPLLWAVLAGQAGGRLVAALEDYTAARRVLFLPRAENARVLPRYLAVTGGAAALSAALVLSGARLGLPVPTAKVLAEALLFAPVYLLQRDRVFRSPPA